MKSPVNALVLAAACFIALWLMAMHGYAKIPLGASRAAALAISSAVLIACGVVKIRTKHFFQATFVLSLALILPEGDPRIIHAVAVYNLFRYFLLLACLVIFIKDTIRALREFS